MRTSQRVAAAALLVLPFTRPSLPGCGLRPGSRRGRKLGARATSAQRHRHPCRRPRLRRHRRQRIDGRLVTAHRRTGGERGPADRRLRVGGGLQSDAGGAFHGPLPEPVRLRVQPDRELRAERRRRARAARGRDDARRHDARGRLRDRPGGEVAPGLPRAVPPAEARLRRVLRPPGGRHELRRPQRPRRP